MAFEKNQLIQLKIDSLSSEGSGVGRAGGIPVFVPDTAPGDEWEVKILKDCKSHAFGLARRPLSLSPEHQEPDCPVWKPCGGCCYRHLRYEAELKAKEQVVRDAFQRIGHLQVEVEPILPSPSPDRYRNKVQFPVQAGPDGKVLTGFYAGRSHRVVACPDCLLQPRVLNEIAGACCEFFEREGILPYDEAAGTGLVRHIFLRQGWHSGQILVCLVLNGSRLPKEQEFCQMLTGRFEAVRTILLNKNTKRTNVILGPECRVLYGPGHIEDTLCGVPVELGPFSFYQVNTAGAEQLYQVAADYADPRPQDLVLDLYCGMGTIGLSMAGRCGRLVGVEIVPEAVESARANAARMGVENARFYCEDAGRAAARLASEGLRPDIIVLDPPRKGCDGATLQAVLDMAPRRVVMVSCNPATAARDSAILAQGGYRPVKVRPVDMFARTKHVEAVILLEPQEEKESGPTGEN